jgi:transcriptional regulator with XRE-family HTH domain
MLGLTVTSYGKIEQGQSDISLSRLQDIAQKLEIDLTELLKNTGGNVFVNCNGNYHQ